MANNNGLEIEKRLLLKRLPYNFKSQGWIEIDQFYTPSGRLRQELIYDEFGKLTDVRFIRQIKKSVAAGVNEESPEEILSLYEYEQVLKSWEEDINWEVKNPLIGDGQ